MLGVEDEVFNSAILIAHPGYLHFNCNDQGDVLAQSAVRLAIGPRRRIVHLHQPQREQRPMEDDSLDIRSALEKAERRFGSGLNFKIQSVDHQLVYWDASGGLSVYRALAGESALLVPSAVVVHPAKNWEPFDIVFVQFIIL